MPGALGIQDGWEREEDLPEGWAFSDPSWQAKGEDKMEGITRDMLPEAHRRLADVIGLEATLRLCETYGGAPLYIPKLDALAAAQRARRIRSEYDGMNTALLARRYGVSMRTVQMILSEAPGRGRCANDPENLISCRGGTR